MRSINISFDIIIPDDITDHDVNEFINFELQIISQINNDNPLKEWSNLNPRFLIIRNL